MNKKIGFDSLLAGAALKFDKIDQYDLELLIEFLKTYHIEVEESEILKSFDEVRHQMELIIKSEEILPYLMKIQKEEVSECLAQLDIYEFTLRKILLMGSVNKENCSENFNSLECTHIEYLMDNGYLTTAWNDDIFHDDFEEIRLTKKGCAYLFKKHHANFVNAFARVLSSLDYDVELLDEYLNLQDYGVGDDFLYDQTAIRICNVKSFENFFEEYDRCPYVKK